MFDQQPRDQNNEHQNDVRKSAGDDQIGKRRRPEKSPATPLSIKRAFQTPPRPRQPRERAKRAKPIGRPPTNDPAVQRRDQRDEDRQWRGKFAIAREQKRARGENEKMRDRKRGGLL